MVSSLSKRTQSTGAGVGNSPEIKRFLQVLIDFLLPVVSLEWDNIKYDSKNFHFPNPFEAKRTIQAPSHMASVLDLSNLAPEPSSQKLTQPKSSVMKRLDTLTLTLTQRIYVENTGHSLKFAAARRD